MSIFSSYRVMSQKINLISEIHYLCKRREYAFICASRLLNSHSFETSNQHFGIIPNRFLPIMYGRREDYLYLKEYSTIRKNSKYSYRWHILFLRKTLYLLNDQNHWHSPKIIHIAIHFWSRVWIILRILERSVIC